MRTDETAADAEPSVRGQPGGGGAAAASTAPPLQQYHALVQACLVSSPGAWDAFVARFAGLLGHVVGRTAAQHGVPLDPADRDDIVAEVLVELVRNDAATLRSFAGRASLTTYLTVIARRVAVRALARLQRQRATGNEGEPVDRHDAVGAVADREAIESLLGKLDETEARLVRMHHLEARSYGEISRLTGLPIGTIGPALSKARQKLREHAGDGVAMS